MLVALLVVLNSVPGLGSALVATQGQLAWHSRRRSSRWYVLQLSSPILVPHSLASLTAHSSASYCRPAWSTPSPGLSASAVECLYPSRPWERLPPTRTCCCHCQLALTMGTGSMSVMRHLQYGHWGARSCRPASSVLSVEQGACGSHCSSCQTLSSEWCQVLQAKEGWQVSSGRTLMLQTALAHSMHMPWWHDATRTSMSASMQMLHSSTSGSAAACRQQLGVCLWFRPGSV